MRRARFWIVISLFSGILLAAGSVAWAAPGTDTSRRIDTVGWIDWIDSLVDHVLAWVVSPPMADKPGPTSPSRTTAAATNPAGTGGGSTTFGGPLLTNAVSTDYDATPDPDG